jgi:hypothetical protein
MPKYWMINNRSQGGVGPDVSADGMTYWVSDKQPLTDIKNWRKVTAANFQKLLVSASDKFPTYNQAENEKQTTSQFLFMVTTKRLQKPQHFMRSFAVTFLMVRIVSGFASCMTGHHAAAS